MLSHLAVPPSEPPYVFVCETCCLFYQITSPKELHFALNSAALTGLGVSSLSQQIIRMKYAISRLTKMLTLLL